jgi:archaellin
MNDRGNLGLISGILLIGFVLIGAVSASVLLNNTTSITNTDLNQLTNEVIDEISTYIQIKTVVGKFQSIHGDQQIQKIAILIKPLVSFNIDITHMIIKISTSNQLYILYFNGNTSPIGPYSLFDHPLWDTLIGNNYTIIPLIDDDSSIMKYHTINKNTDNAFLLLNLPDDSAMKKGDILEITLIPSPGTERTVILEAPLPTSHVVTLFG